MFSIFIDSDDNWWDFLAKSGYPRYLDRPLIPATLLHITNCENKTTTGIFTLNPPVGYGDIRNIVINFQSNLCDQQICCHLYQNGAVE